MLVHDLFTVETHSQQTYPYCACVTFLLITQYNKKVCLMCWSCLLLISTSKAMEVFFLKSPLCKTGIKYVHRIYQRKNSNCFQWVSFSFIKPVKPFLGTDFAHVLQPGDLSKRSPKYCIPFSYPTLLY
ncbi:hypothetical protein FKM82_013272 [Ascaphus truei]